SLNASEVTVTESTGEPLDVHDVGPGETINRGTRIYTSAVGFTVETGDDYTLSLATPGPRQVIVSRSLGETFRSVAGWVVSGVLAGVMFIAGVVLLIVTSVRRRRRP